MYARAVDEAGLRLRRLRRDAREAAASAAVALALAVGATRALPALVAPLIAGGLTGARAPAPTTARRWDLLERLAGDGDAHIIPEVRAFAVRETTMEKREWCAYVIRRRLEEPAQAAAVLRPTAGELEALAVDLDDALLVLDPAAAVACVRLVGDLTDLPRCAALAPDVLRSRVVRIRAGFRAAALAA